MLFGGLFRLLVSLQSSSCFGWVSNLSARPAQQEQGIPPHILTFELFPPLSSQTSALTDSSGNVDDEQKADHKEFQRAAFPEIPEEYTSFVSELQQAMAESGTLMEAEIGLVADYKVYQEQGSNTATYLQNIGNQVSRILENEAGLKLKITQTVVHTSSNDPFTGTTSPSSLLNEFASYKGNSSNPVYGTDLAHLFTNRNLDGSVIGIAWLSTSRGNSYAAGLSQDYTSDNKSMVLLTAHKIGHNLAAPHDNQSGSASAPTPSGYVMNPWLSSSLALQYSDCAKSFIAGEMGSVSCLDTVSTSPYLHRHV